MVRALIPPPLSYMLVRKRSETDQESDLHAGRDEANGGNDDEVQGKRCTLHFFSFVFFFFLIIADFPEYL